MKRPDPVTLLGSLLYRRSARKAADAAYHGDVSAVLELIRIFCNSRDLSSREISKKALCSLKSPAAVDVVCTEVLSFGDASLTQLALDCGYEPSDPDTRALFFFLLSRSGNDAKKYPWTIDCQLARGYLQSDARIRERVREYAKKNNHCPHLAYALIGTNAAEHAPEFSYDEWDVVISGLVQDCRWDLLWTLITFAPLPKTVEIVHAIKASRWHPDGDEKDAWGEIIAKVPDDWIFPSPQNLLHLTIGTLDNQSFRLVFSADGSHLCSARSDGTVIIWYASSGNLISTLTTGLKSLRFLAFSRDNSHLICSDDTGSVQYWNIRRGECSWTYQAEKGSLLCFGTTCCGETVIIGGLPGTLRMVKGENGHDIQSFGGYPSRITSLILSPDNQTLAGGYADGTLCLWNLSSGSFFVVLKGDGDPVKSLAIDGVGNTILVLFEHSFPIIWDIKAARRSLTLSGHCGNITCCSTTPDGRFLALGTVDNVLRLWRSTECCPVATIPFYKRRITTCETVSDGTLLVAGDSEGALKIIRTADGSCIKDVKGHTGSVTAISRSPDDSYIATAGWDGSVKLWSIPSGELIRILHRPSGPVTAIDHSSDGSHIAAGFSDGTIKIYQRTTGELIRQSETYTGGVRSLAISPDGTLLACAGADATLRFWDLMDGSLAGSCEGVSSGIWCLAFAPDQKTLFSGGWDGAIRFWSVPEGHFIRMLKGHTSNITCCAVSPAGDILATGSNDMTIRLWALPEGRPAGILKGTRGEIRALAFSPDGMILAAAGQDTFIRIYHQPGGICERTIPGLSGIITGLDFTPDGNALAVGYDNGMMILINLATGGIIRTVHAHTAAVSGIVTVPGCEELVTSGSDGALRVWHLPWTKFLAQTTTADISRVISWEEGCTDHKIRHQWAFLHLLLSLRFQNEIEVCALLQDTDAYEIQIVG
jgi:WD40 repeat protein